eukprot:TRINITY_DN14742_c0_g1_i1.p2 TRINITY_DN14742_c0_g1~~TRINITY_DN14742_c0_g1_i1.p2  ORF type:complete len:217 (+),score=64.95 TRINITY_DN14742_c0_g1_i1:103-753(+)
MMFAKPKGMAVQRRKIAIHEQQPPGPGAGRYNTVGQAPERIHGGALSKVTTTPRAKVPKDVKYKSRACEEAAYRSPLRSEFDDAAKSTPGRRSASSGSRARSLTRDTSVLFPNPGSPGPAAYTPRVQYERTTTARMNKGWDRDFSSFLITPGGSVVKKIRGGAVGKASYVAHENLDQPSMNAYARAQTARRERQNEPSQSPRRASRGGSQPRTPGS